MAAITLSGITPTGGAVGGYDFGDFYAPSTNTPFVTVTYNLLSDNVYTPMNYNFADFPFTGGAFNYGNWTAFPHERDDRPASGQLWPRHVSRFQPWHMG